MSHLWQAFLDRCKAFPAMCKAFATRKVFAKRLRLVSEGPALFSLQQSAVPRGGFLLHVLALWRTHADGCPVASSCVDDAP